MNRRPQSSSDQHQICNICPPRNETVKGKISFWFWKQIVTTRQYKYVFELISDFTTFLFLSDSLSAASIPNTTHIQVLHASTELLPQPLEQSNPFHYKHYFQLDHNSIVPTSWIKNKGLEAQKMPYPQLVSSYGRSPPPVPGNFQRIQVGASQMRHSSVVGRQQPPNGPFNQRHQYPNMYSPFYSCSAHPKLHRFNHHQHQQKFFHQQSVTQGVIHTSGRRQKLTGILRHPGSGHNAKSGLSNSGTPVRRVSFSRDAKPDTSMYRTSGHMEAVKQKHRFRSGSASLSTASKKQRSPAAPTRSRGRHEYNPLFHPSWWTRRKRSAIHRNG